MMKSRLLFLLKYYIFWIVFSVVAKGLFLVYQYSETSSLEIADYWMILWKGLRMDLSFGGYIMMLSSVILVLGVFLPSVWVKRIFSGLTFLLLLICSLVVVGDLELFKNWGYHMDATPLLYLKTPGDALASTPTWLILLLIALCIVLVCVFYIF